MGKWLHRLHNIDVMKKEAVCLSCGVVSIYFKPSTETWICREARRIEKREWRKTHKDTRVRRYGPSDREAQKQYLRKIRLEVIVHYGGKCTFCGDSNPNHLTFDHINNDGSSHRKTINTKNIALWLKRNNYPDNFQLLCWNHNCEKGVYGTMTL